MIDRRRPVALLALLTALVLAFVACGDDDDDSDAATTTTAAGTGGGAEENAANAVTIDMKEYAFDVAGSIKAGDSTVVMRNTGQEMHMTAFALLKEGMALSDVQAALASGDESAFEGVVEKEVDSPGGLLSPGQTMEITTPFLDAGTYALLCFIPTVGEAVPHVAKGMVNTLEVGEGDVSLSPNTDARYTIEDGEIDGPTSLDAGRMTIEMSAAGEGPHELIVARKKAPTTTFEQIDAAFTALFEAPTPPAPGYAEALPAVIAGNTFDVESGQSVFMTLDLPPGDYLMGCAREPDEEGAGEAHTREMLDVEVT